MRFEFVVFKSVVDLLSSVNAYFSAPGIRPFFALDSYRGYIMHLTALGTDRDEIVMLAFVTKGSIPAGIIEYDLVAKKFAQVENISRPDKLYFAVVEPQSSTVGDQVVAAYESSYSQ
jgi:hypothetical protein